MSEPTKTSYSSYGKIAPALTTNDSHSSNGRMAPGVTTIGIIGCGNIGSAVLAGFLRASRGASEKSPGASLRLVVTTKSETSAKRLRAEHVADAHRVTVLVGENVRAMEEADVIILALLPCDALGLMKTMGVYAAVACKPVISLMFGVSFSTLEAWLGATLGDRKRGLYMFRAIPNMAARICKSMTVIDENFTHSGSRQDVTRLLEMIGKVKYLPTGQFQLGATLANASMAMAAVASKGITDGCVDQGLRKGEALEMSAQVLKGMAGLFEEGTYPVELTESITSQGYTTQSMWDLEKKGVRVAFAEAVVQAAKSLRNYY
ncbi:hypothetical protein BJX76DRAFT_359379 [Aspergillus varians]